MKLIKPASLIIIAFLSCNDSKNTDARNDLPVKQITVDTPSKVSFFPVTDFLAGQIADIKRKGINPIKITRIKNKQDSAWLKIEDLDREVAVFLTPVIDSINLAGMFKENSFLDQTIAAFTFTYDPVKPLPDSFPLRRWDVYVDQQSNKVKRIYLVKKDPEYKMQQLSWIVNQSCKIVNIATDKNGRDYVEQEITIKWDF